MKLRRRRKPAAILYPEIELCRAIYAKEFEDSPGLSEILKPEIEKALLQLPPKEQLVLRLRYGFEEGKKKTLREIGER